MGRIIFMTEEKSMKATLCKVLPKLAPDFREFEHWLVIEHKGKSDLEKSFPRKVKQWQEPGVRFIILRDNDGGDCRVLKRRLLDLLPADAPDCLVRIVCQELESWLIGDTTALATAYPAATRHGSFRRLTQTDPDTLNNASELAGQFTETAAKTIRASEIATHMEPSRNRSTSFQVFCRGVELFRQLAIA
jgi:hypothetical protein